MKKESEKWSGAVMSDIREEVVECERIETHGARDVEVLKRKDALGTITAMVQRPILKCGNQYAIIDGQTAYVYEEK